MANGNMKSQSQYYGDSKYTGVVGSPTNMYVIEDIYDFLNLRSNNSLVYYDLVNDLDFNSHESLRLGITGPIHTTSLNLNAHIYANGHKIKNIYAKATNGGFKLSQISLHFYDAIFTNFIIRDFSDNAYLLDGGQTFNRCKIGFYLVNTRVCRVLSDHANDPAARVKFTDCVVTLKGVLNVGVPLTGLYADLIRTKFIFDLSLSNQVGRNLQLGGYNSKTRFRMEDSALTGSIVTAGDSAGFELSYADMNNSYIAVSSNEGFTVSHSGCSFTGASYIDEELLGSNIKESSLVTAGFYKLTTADAKSLTYLQNIGFFTL